MSDPALWLMVDIQPAPPEYRTNKKGQRCLVERATARAELPDGRTLIVTGPQAHVGSELYKTLFLESEYARKNPKY